MAQGQQVAHGLAHCLLLILDDATLGKPRHLTVDHHQRHAGARQQVRQIRLRHGAAVEDDGIAAPIGQQGHRLLLPRRIIMAIGHHQLLARQLRLGGDLLEQTPEVGASKVGDDQPDDITGIASQGLSQHIDPKPQLVDGGQHPLPGRLADGGLATEHPRYRGLGYPGPLCHILHGRHPLLLVCSA